MPDSMQDPMGTTRSRLGIAAWMLAFVVLSSGCDQLDVSAFSPPTPVAKNSGHPAERAEASSNRAPARSRDPDMQSIGPDESQRVYYQFVDDAGRVQFVERLADVPAAWHDRVGYVEMSQPPPLSPQEARRTWKLSASRTTEILIAAANSRSTSALGENAGQSGSVLLYSASWCGYCTKAKAHQLAE